MRYLNLALSWLRVGMLLRRPLSGDHDTYKVLAIRPNIIQLERLTGFQAKFWCERKIVEDDYIPVNKLGAEIEKPEIHPRIQYVIQHLTKQIQDKVNEAIVLEYIRSASSYGLEFESVDDKDISNINEFDKLLHESLEPVIEYLVDTCNWDEYVKSL